jgi:hypothetical protein
MPPDSGVPFFFVLARGRQPTTRNSFLNGVWFPFVCYSATPHPPWRGAGSRGLSRQSKENELVIQNGRKPNDTNVNWTYVAFTKMFFPLDPSKTRKPSVTHSVIYIYTYIYILYIVEAHTHMHIHLSISYVCLSFGTSIYIYIHVYKYVHVYLYV